MVVASEFKWLRRCELACATTTRLVTTGTAIENNDEDNDDDGDDSINNNTIGIKRINLALASAKSASV